MFFAQLDLIGRPRVIARAGSMSLTQIRPWGVGGATWVTPPLAVSRPRGASSAERGVRRPMSRYGHCLPPLRGVATRCIGTARSLG